MQDIRAIIFDFDGTLVDTSEDIADAINATRKHFQLRSLDVETIRMCIGKSARNLVQLCLTDSNVDPKEGYEFFRSYYKEHLCEKSCLYPGVLDLLRGCVCDGISRAIVSNKPASSIWKLSEHLGIEKYFETVIGIDSFNFCKPDARVAVEAMNQMKSTVKETIVIGDNSIDIEMAMNAGIRSIFLQSGFATMMSSEADPTWTLKNMEEVKKLIFGV
jgi:phosphoglycolate phosphatase